MEVLREIINSDRLNITGIIQEEGMSLDDYRNERLGKYAGID